MLLVCGLASSQTSYKPASEKAKTRLHTVSTPSASRSTYAKIRRLRKKSRQRGQEKIDAERAREIQQALIRERYMNGEATGVWDANSQDAMVRFQADNGWQSKVVPDSRALIKLGLGPDHEHLLNPESAMTSQPEPPRTSPMLNQRPAMITLPQK